VTVPGKTILLVEADREIRTIARRALESHGYTVLEAESPADALSNAVTPTTRIDLLIQDVVASREDTTPSLLAALRRDTPDLRALFTSSFFGEADPRDIHAQPHAEVLEKPYTPSMLRAAVRRLLASPVCGRHS
jgi:CheY-like chemotaxis protein